MLGIATGAVRIRLARGTLPRVRDGGTVYVLLPADMSPDTERDAGDVPTSMLHGAPDTLKSELRDRLLLPRMSRGRAPGPLRSP